jgi:hypothetical protein
MFVSSPERPAEDLPGLVESSDGDRPSITDVNGTVARFEMAYNPREDERLVFGPPLWQRAPSLVYLGFALALAGAVFAAYHGATSNSSLYVWVVEGDRNRAMGAVPLVSLVVLSAFATVIRAGMRGVIVSRDGVEARYLLALGVPRIKRWTWSQIDRLVLDEEDVMLELWDGSYERLPRVRDGKGLASLLERVAAGRGRVVTRLPRRA